MQILCIDRYVQETIFHPILTPSDFSGLFKLPIFIAKNQAIFIKLSHQLLRADFRITVITIIRFGNRKIPYQKPFRCFLEISNLPMVKNMFCFYLCKKYNLYATFRAVSFCTMPYFMHLYLLMAMRAIAVHIFFSAVAIIDISAVRHRNRINPIIKVLWQGLYFLHFPVYAFLNHCMLLLKPLLQNHVLRLSDFCIPTSLYPFILRIGKVGIHRSFRSGITKNRFFLAIVIIRKQRV